jgi:hypothetical protein
MNEKLNVPAWAVVIGLFVICCSALRGIIVIHHDCSCYIDGSFDDNDDGGGEAEPKPAPSRAQDLADYRRRENPAASVAGAIFKHG